MHDLPRKLTVDDLAALFEGRTQFVQRLAECENPLAEAARVLRAAPEAERIEAFNAHPRIGERKLSAISAAEQGTDEDPAVMAELARLNQVYERKFGFKFLVFVNRRSRTQILEVMRERMTRSRDEEMETAVDELVAVARDRWQRGQQSERRP
jgi:2-oxo-4-hydroxy-4-carboxy--5-ureidoimidazoline (OHCU) decarboxylase